MAPGLARQGWLPAIPDRFLRQWENAYRTYGTVSDQAVQGVSVDPDTARAMATVSTAVADAWRDIAAVPDLPWWALAALDAAAEAFETQAAEWDARSTNEENTG